MKLTVIQAFGDFAVGDSISDQAVIQSILDSEQAAYVVQAFDQAPDVQPEKLALKATDVKTTSVVTSDNATDAII